MLIDKNPAFSLIQTGLLFLWLLSVGPRKPLVIVEVRTFLQAGRPSGVQLINWKS